MIIHEFNCTVYNRTPLLYYNRTPLLYADICKKVCRLVHTSSMPSLKT